MKTQTSQNQTLQKVGELATKAIEKTEIFLVLISLSGIALKMYEVSFGSLILTLGLLILSVIYFFRAYAMPEDELAGGLERFVDKLIYISLSVLTIGILFRLQSWPGYETMIPIGLLTLIVTLIAIIYFKNKKPELKIFNIRVIIRIIVMIIIAVFLKFASPDTLIKCKIIKEPFPIENTNHKNLVHE